MLDSFCKKIGINLLVVYWGLCYYSLSIKDLEMSLKKVMENYINKIEKDFLEEKLMKWLDSHGGRDQTDVECTSNGKLYVIMGDGHGGWNKIYLPEICG